MLTIPAHYINTAPNSDEELTNPARQYSDFPFNPELRAYLQNLYKESFFTLASSGNEDLVRVKQLLAFGIKDIESIDLYMVGVYFQGDLSDSSLKDIPIPVFKRLGFENRPEDFFTNKSKYILSLTTWSHVIIENGPVNLGFIKSSEWCRERMDPLLKSHLKISGAGSLKKGRCRLSGAITIQYNYSFGKESFGIMAGKAVFVEIPRANLLSSIHKKLWEKKLAAAKKKKDAAAADDTSTKEVNVEITDASSTAPSSVTTCASSSVAADDADTDADAAADNVADITTVTSSSKACCLQDNYDKNESLKKSHDDSFGADDTSNNEVNVEIKDAPAIAAAVSLVALGLTQDNYEVNEEIKDASSITASASSLVVLPSTLLEEAEEVTVEGAKDFSSGAAAAAADDVADTTTITSSSGADNTSNNDVNVEIKDASSIAASASSLVALPSTLLEEAEEVTVEGAKDDSSSNNEVRVITSAPDQSTVAPSSVTTYASSSVAADDADTDTDADAAVDFADTTTVTSSSQATLQENYDEHESSKKSLKRIRKDYWSKYKTSLSICNIQLDDLLLKNSVEENEVKTLIKDMKAFATKKLDQVSEGTTIYKKAISLAQTTLKTITTDAQSLVLQKSGLQNNAFKATKFVPAIIITTERVGDKWNLKDHRAKNPVKVNNEANLEGDEQMVFLGLKALVYNMQDSFIRSLQIAYLDHNINYDKIIETYGHLSQFIKKWFILLEPAQQIKIFNLFIEQDESNKDAAPKLADDCNEILHVLTTKTLLDVNEFVGRESMNRCEVELVLIWEPGNHAFSISTKGKTGTTTTKANQARTNYFFTI